jgi:nitrogen regulatory protein PII
MMAYLVVLVIDNVDHCPSVLDAWEEAGVTGVTILESSGIGRARRAGLRRDDYPLMLSLHDILQSKERHHRTVFSVVDTEEQVQTLAKAAESVMGDFDQPHTGMMFVVELHQVFGLEKPALRQDGDTE